MESRYHMAALRFQKQSDAEGTAMANIPQENPEKPNEDPQEGKKIPCPDNNPEHLPALIAHLAAHSRKLERPLSVVIQHRESGLLMGTILPLIEEQHRTPKGVKQRWQKLLTSISENPASRTD